MPGSNGQGYTITYTSVVLEKHIPALPASARALIRKDIVERLQTNPLRYGKPLKRSLKGYRRIRVSDYRVVYRIEEESKQVRITAIGHRKDVYDH